MIYSIAFLMITINKKAQPKRLSLQLVEKVQHMLGFLLFLWYNKSGDENVGKES